MRRLTSPVGAALEELLFAGCQARMHVLLAGYLNRPLRLQAGEYFSALALGRVTGDTCERLAPHIDTAADGETHPGRVHVVQCLAAHPTQVLLVTDAEAAAWVAAPAAGQTGRN